MPFLGGKIKRLTSFFSFEYLGIFLPVFLVLFTVAPQKYKKYILLLSSYAFFWFISGRLLAVLLGVTAIAYYGGLHLEKLKEKHRQHVKEQVDKATKKIVKEQLRKLRQKKLLWLILLLLVILIGFKYLNFIFNTVVSIGGTPSENTTVIFKFAVPIGISFFTMQMIAYLVDIHRDTIKADKNWLRVALFFAFFPQIIEGPIVRYAQTAEQVYNVRAITYDNLVFGLQRILYGMFKKLVVVDRLNAMVGIIFKQYTEFDGSIVLIGAIAYTIQLYMEFSGSLDAVIGVSQILGIKMPENFKQPFASKTISEFWQRWHITLGTFFKDYIFYPISLSQPMKKLTTKSREKMGATYGPLMSSAIALFVVWVFNGLWHGPEYSFLFFGLYHFVFILLETLFLPFSQKIATKINTQSFWYQVLQRIRTMIIVIIGELFFRAATLNAGVSMFSHMVNKFTLNTDFFELIKRLKISVPDIVLVILSLLIVTAISRLKEKDKNVRGMIATLPIVWRWLFWYAVIIGIMLFGAYGGSYVPVDPIYANF